MKKDAERDIFQKLERIQNSLYSIKDVKQRYNKLQAEIQTATDKKRKLKFKSILCINSSLTMKTVKVSFLNMVKCFYDFQDKNFLT